MKALHFTFAFAIFCNTLLSAHNPLDWHLSYEPYFRNINSVQILDDSTIFIAGGNEINDRIRTLSYSFDRGHTWNVRFDLFDSSWVKSMYFVNPAIGFMVGYEGFISKTTDGGSSWILQQTPGIAASRNFSSVFFINSQTGFIAGGHQSNDSIQTILKTTDGGNSWSIKRDVRGFWLKAIYFTDQQNGFAVGEKGVALKTTDGGNNWNQVTLPQNVSQRNFNSIFFIDSTTGFLGGGNKANDSIQTILKTTNGGTSWNIISDALGSWITSIYFPEQFPSTTTGFAVGDRGTVLITNNTGDSWNIVAIPDSVNDDNTALHSVHFFNLDFGIAGGGNGKILVYRSPLVTVPIVETGFAETGFDNATIHGTVSANDSNAYVSFEYGTTSAFDNPVEAIPNSVFGSAFTPLSANITGLIPHTIYQYRAKAINSNGVAYGAIKQFYTGDNVIPNWDFELWHTLTASIPKDWMAAGSILQTTSYDGSKAVGLSGHGISGRLAFSGIFLGFQGDDVFYGGVPFPARPDSLIGYFNYNLVPNDSALIILLFKKNGIFNSQEIYRITGNSNGNYERLSFPISFSDTEVPDSLILGFLNSNAFSGIPDTNSYLAIDNISFSGTSLNVPNNNFENWDTVSVERLDNWYSRDQESTFLFFSNVTKTSDSHHGNFAAKLQNVTDMQNEIATIYASESNSSPAFAVHTRHYTLNGYLKFFPENDDSLFIRVDMYKDSLIGAGELYIDTTISAYSPFSITIDYYVPNIIPDSANIQIYTSAPDKAKGNSVLYIDNLSFDGFFTSQEKLKVSQNNDLSWNIFPNPAQDKITVSGFSAKDESVYFSIIDLNGKIIQKINKELTTGKFEFQLEMKNVQQGNYIITLQRNGSRQFRKLIISR